MVKSHLSYAMSISKMMEKIYHCFFYDLITIRLTTQSGATSPFLSNTYVFTRLQSEEKVWRERFSTQSCEQTDIVWYSLVVGYKVSYKFSILDEPKIKGTIYGPRSFVDAALHEWNKIPFYIKKSDICF